MDNALKGSQNNARKAPVAAQARPHSGAADFEHGMAEEKRIQELEEQIASKNSELEKEKIKHEKMQVQIMNIAEFQFRKREKEKRRAHLVSVAEDEIKKLRETNKSLQSTINRQANQFVRLQKRDQQQAGAGITQTAAAGSARTRVSMPKSYDNVTRLGQDEDPFASELGKMASSGLKLDDYASAQNTKYDGAAIDAQTSQKAQLKQIN